MNFSPELTPFGSEIAPIGPRIKLPLVGLRQMVKDGVDEEGESKFALAAEMKTCQVRSRASKRVNQVIY
eukprot:1196391-Prorocentrum_minimum.AAC.6